MGQKITAIRIDLTDDTLAVRALSQNRRGARFTLRALPKVKKPLGKASVKAALKKSVLELLEGKAPSTTN